MVVQKYMLGLCKYEIMHIDKGNGWLQLYSVGFVFGFGLGAPLGGNAVVHYLRGDGSTQCHRCHENPDFEC